VVFLNARHCMGWYLALGRCDDPGPHGGKDAPPPLAWRTAGWRVACPEPRHNHCSDLACARAATRQIGYWDSTESAKDLRVTGSEYVRGNVTLTNGALSAGHP